jgi:hypothetical protein
MVEEIITATAGGHFAHSFYTIRDATVFHRRKRTLMSFAAG